MKPGVIYFGVYRRGTLLFHILGSLPATPIGLAVAEGMAILLEKAFDGKLDEGDYIAYDIY